MITENHTCNAWDDVENIPCPNPATRIAWEYRGDGKPDHRVYFCEDCLRHYLGQFYDPEDVTDPIDMEPDEAENRLRYGLHYPDLIL